MTGAFAAKIALASSTATTDIGNVTATGGSGTLTLNASTGILTGSFTSHTNGQVVSFPSGLVSIANANTNTFTGFYNGTTLFNSATGSPANTLAMIIDGTGKITAILGVNITGETNNDGVATGNIVSTTGAVTVGQATGTFKLKSGVLSGTLAGGTTSQNQPLTLVITLNANT